MIRPQFDIPIPVGDQETGLTIREVAEWYKAHLGHDITPTGEENNYMNKRWAFLVSNLAREQQVPVGWLSSVLNELVEAEWALKVSAELEAVASGGAEILQGNHD